MERLSPAAFDSELRELERTTASLRTAVERARELERRWWPSQAFRQGGASSVDPVEQSFAAAEVD
jgi:hypothetical protein